MPSVRIDPAELRQVLRDRPASVVALALVNHELGNIYPIARLSATAHELLGAWVHCEDCINIIAYREIALKNWQNIFETFYTRPHSKKMAGGKDAKTSWMVRLEKLRNQNFHSYYVTEGTSFLK